jgi:hypothetical protein
MVNVGLLILYTFIFLLIIAIVIFAFHVSTSQQLSTINNDSNNGTCIKSTNDPSLIQLTEDIPCCINSLGGVTNRRYVESLNAVVSTSPTFYLNACAGFCGTGGVGSDGNCVNGNTENFNTCIQLTKPVNCDGTAMPVAALGPQLFYILSATNANCINTSTCL